MVQTSRQEQDTRSQTNAAVGFTGERVSAMLFVTEGSWDMAFGMQE